MLQRILYSFFSKGIVALINFLILLLSARYLGVRTRGEVSVFLINIALVQVINEVYTGYSLVHFLQKYNHRKLLQNGLVLTLFLSAFASILLPLRQSFALSALAYFPILVLVLLHSYFCVILLGKQRLKVYNLIALLQPMLLLVFLGIQIFVIKTFTFHAYYFALTASFALALPFSAFFMLQAMRGTEVFSDFNFKKILSKGVYLQAGTLMLFFINRYNYYVLGDAEKIGLYSTASGLMDALLLLAAATSPVLLARLSVMKDSAIVLLRILRLALLTVLLLYVLSWCLPESLLLLLVGKGYLGIRMIMIGYGPAVVFQSGCIILGQYYIASGQQMQLVRLYLIPFILHLFLAPILILIFGISGAALASGLSFLFVLIRLYLNFCKKEDLAPSLIFKKFSLTKEIQLLTQVN